MLNPNDLTPEEVRLTIQMLENVQIGGKPQAIRKTLEVHDSILRKLRASLEVKPEQPEKPKPARKR